MRESVPKVLFKGTFESWKQYKLKDVANYFRGSFPQPYGNKEWFDDMNGNPFVQVADIGFDLRLKDETKSKISKLAEPKSRYVKKGKVIVALQGSIETSIGRVAITQYDAFVDRTILIFDSYNVPINEQFFAYVIQRIFKREKESAPGVTISTITKEALGYFDTALPSIETQQKTGTFFKQLDDTISLQQQLVEQQKHYKKAMLQKMFPQKGERVPKVRFDGFSGDWEERRAENIFKSISEKNHEELPILSATQNKGMVYRDEVGIDIKFDEKSKKSYKRVIPNQFVIHLRSFQGGFAFSDKEGITSPAYTILDFKTNDQNNPMFWKEVLRSQSFIKRLETVTYGIRDGRSISYSDFSTLKFLVPSLKEQQKIGTFFKQLDDAITLYKLKLQNYQQLKKALLERMFV